MIETSRTFLVIGQRGGRRNRCPLTHVMDGETDQRGTESCLSLPGCFKHSSYSDLESRVLTYDLSISLMSLWHKHRHPWRSWMGPMENTPLSCLFKSENESERKKTRTMGGGVLCTSGTLKKFFCISDALTSCGLANPGETAPQD